MKNIDYNHNSIADIIAFAIKATTSRPLQTRSGKIIVVNQEYKYSILFAFHSYSVFSRLKPITLTIWD